MAIVLFGLTGGVASGKSAVARHWREAGLPVLDADRIAREVVEPGSEGLARVVARFGRAVLGPAGGLDRAALGELVFADRQARADLEAIVHPLIRGRTVVLTEELDRGGERLACYEAALLVENGLAELFRPLVVVTAPRLVQLERMRLRDGLSSEDAERRLAAQLPLADKVAAADYVIENAGALGDTLRAADAVLRDIEEGSRRGRWLPAALGSLEPKRPTDP